MAFAIEHGILGLEGIHRLSNLVDLNTQGDLPRIELDRIVGLHSLPEADDNREAKYGQGGEQVYLSLARGRTITYEGRLVATDIYGLRSLARSLRYAAGLGRAGHSNVPGTSIVVRPDPAVGGISHSYIARVLALDIDDEQARGYESMPSPFQREFVMSVRQADPRYYAVGVDVWGGGVNGAISTVTHPGNAPAQPVFVVDGPISGQLVFERLDNTVAANLTYEDVELDGGQQLRLDFSQRTLVRVSDLEPYEQHRDFSGSNWWDPGFAGANPGDTQMRVTGGGAWTVSFAPAQW
jgi:hypothetical protein